MSKSFVIAQNEESTAVLQHYLTHGWGGTQRRGSLVTHCPLGYSQQRMQKMPRQKMQRLMTESQSPRNLQSDEESQRVMEACDHSFASSMRAEDEGTMGSEKGYLIQEG